MPFSFKGGISPESRKERTFAVPIERMRTPATVCIPLSQHTGPECLALVSEGEHVLMGQKIGDSPAYEACPVHASVSGTVVAIRDEWHPSGEKKRCIVIKSDFENKPHPSCVPYAGDPDAMTPEDIIAEARDAGIVGMGGGAYPLHLKLKTAAEKGTELLIINGLECEPFVTADHRAMVEYPNAIVGGIKLVMQCLKPKAACVAVATDKPDAIATMRSLCEGLHIDVVPLPSTYPQGGEKQLTQAITGREVPVGKHALDIGVVVLNVDTCACLYRKINRGTPLIKRVVTVSGPAVVNPKNLLVCLGTPYKDLFETCGGFIEPPTKIVAGGPLRGRAQYSLETPLTKDTPALLAFAEPEEERETHCIRCGKCVRVCPMRLMPNYLYAASRAGRYNACADLHVEDCMECGCCSYVCPGKLGIVQAIRKAKNNLEEKQG